MEMQSFLQVMQVEILSAREIRLGNHIYTEQVVFHWMKEGWKSEKLKAKGKLNSSSYFSTVSF